MGKGSLDEFGSATAPTRWYLFIAICAQIPGIIAFILVSVLFGQYRGGFGWGTNLTQVFNYHPLFMTLGMVFLYGDAILVYRVFYDVKKLYVKVLHASLLALSIIFAGVGLKAVFDSHNKANPPLDNMYSIHSWTGLTSVVLFGLQWVCGFVAFLFPGLRDSVRSAYMPSHKLWGKVIFGLAVAALLMGVSEYGVIAKLNTNKELLTQRNVFNVFAIFIMLFSAMVFYLLGNPGFQRPEEINPEEVPLTETK